MSAILKIDPYRDINFKSTIIPRIDFIRIAVLEGEKTESCFSMKAIKDPMLDAVRITVTFEIIGIGRYFNRETRFYRITLNEIKLIHASPNISIGENAVKEMVEIMRNDLHQEGSLLFRKYLRKLKGPEFDATLPMQTIEVLEFNEQMYKNFDNF